MVFQSKYPTSFDIIGMSFALLGAVVMTVDFSMVFRREKVPELELSDGETQNSSLNSSEMTYRTQHTDWTVPTYYHRHV
jgi:hypothetical protein